MNTQTRPAQKQEFSQPQGGAVAVVAPRILMPDEARSEFGINLSQWRVLVEAVFPSAKTPASILMAMEYCLRRNLDVFKKPVHIVPMWNSALRKEVETVWPGIAELRTTAFRTTEYAGCDPVEWGPVIEREFEDEKETWDRGQKTGTITVKVKVRFHEWGRMTVHRMMKSGAVRAFVGPQVYWEETYATSGKTIIPNDRWQRAPNGQHEKTIEAAALRKAFPEELGGEYAAEEMEGKTIIESVPYVVREPTMPPEPPAPPVDHSPIESSAGQQKPAAVQTVEKPSIDFEAWLSELSAAAAAAGDDRELRAVWNSVAAAYKQAPETIQKRANKVLNDRKKALAEPAQIVDAPAASEPLDGASFEAFLERFDKALSKAEGFDVLDALYAEQVDGAHEAGQITRAQIEGPIAKIYDKHRQRIDEDGFPGDRP
ncbi:phage recombination protein Bet [Prosthecomicrobium hirschii]|uniref:phage recombination protein Bet n=1 Tax=Prosthecodimorpha hirschii TaxID=665126 RepID=UPI0022204795|nr:phage recombination protein Bet [Prosthecomicrobium hirschii]MCW1844187.1 phage recombination protein Bet [Prosthecomicrobium hirschii]